MAAGFELLDEPLLFVPVRDRRKTAEGRILLSGDGPLERQDLEPCHTRACGAYTAPAGSLPRKPERQRRRRPRPAAMGTSRPTGGPIENHLEAARRESKTDGDSRLLRQTPLRVYASHGA